MLDADARVFKSSGPVLVKQDVGEAKENVKKRLDYIRSEMYVDWFCLVSSIVRDFQVSMIRLKNRVKEVEPR